MNTKTVRNPNNQNARLIGQSPADTHASAGIDSRSGELLVAIGQGTNGGATFIDNRGAFAGIALPQRDQHRARQQS